MKTQLEASIMVVMKFIFAIIVILFACSATAVDYPQYQSVYLNDFANVLDDDQEAALIDGMKELREKTGIEMVVVSIERMSDYGYTAYDYKPFATGLFNDWGVGDGEYNDGVMILMSTQDRFARIEVGRGYGKDMDARAQSVFDQEMLPNLRRNEFGEGLMNGARGMLREVQDYNTPSAIEARKSKFRMFLVSIAGGLGILGTAIISIMRMTHGGRVALRGLSRIIFGKLFAQKCKKCSGKLKQLSEFDAVNYLSASQQTEVTLKAMEHLVSRCVQCQVIDIKSYRNRLSGTHNCPQCHQFTVTKEKVEMIKATNSVDGIRHINSNCHNCDYKFTREVRVSSRSSSSGSSGGGSFGGGSSSGGGGGGRF